MTTVAVAPCLCTTAVLIYILNISITARIRLLLLPSGFMEKSTDECNYRTTQDFALVRRDCCFAELKRMSVITMKTSLSSDILEVNKQRILLELRASEHT